MNVDPNKTPAGLLHIHTDRFNQETIESHFDWTAKRALDRRDRIVDKL
ncbi:MAG: hypothetical protein JXA42_18400 [Anaerolineales bacterium]|nr:hypothetical protein [Anaerolineales bacterium]